MLHPKEKAYAQACTEIAEGSSTTDEGYVCFPADKPQLLYRKKTTPLKPFWARPDFYFRLLFLEKPTDWLLKSGNTVSFTGLYFFFHPCPWQCWSVGRRTWPRGQGEDPLAGWKCPGQWFSLTSAWERRRDKDAGGVRDKGSCTAEHLLPAASSPPPAL